MKDFLLQGNTLWQKIWSYQQWPKVTYSLCLVGRCQILTWHQLTKWGLYGPTKLCMCEEAEEDAKHLLNEFSYAVSLWQHLEYLFCSNDRDNASI